MNGGKSDSSAGTATAAAGQLAALLAPAPVHGQLDKAGIVDPQHWLASLAEARTQRFEQWLRQTDFNPQLHYQAGQGQELLANPPDPLYPYCEIWTSDAYRQVPAAGGRQRRFLRLSSRLFP